MTRTPQEIQDWLVARVSGLTGIPAGEIDPRKSIRRYGLDSLTAVALAAQIEEWLCYRFRENPLEKHPTIEALSRFLAERAGP